MIFLLIATGVALVVAAMLTLRHVTATRPQTPSDPPGDLPTRRTVIVRQPPTLRTTSPARSTTSPARSTTSPARSTTSPAPAEPLLWPSDEGPRAQMVG